METSKEVFNVQTLEYAKNVFGIFSDEIIYIVPGGLIWSLFAFVLSIVVLIILKKKRLFQRDHKVWNLISKLHYPIWIVVFIVTGFAYGVINAVGARAENVLEETGKPYIEASIPILYQQLLNELPVSSPDEKITIRSASEYLIKDLVYTPKSDSQVETMKSKAISWITSRVGNMVTIYAVNALVTVAIQGAGKALDFSDEDLEFNQTSLIDIDFYHADRTISQIVYEAIKNKIKSFFSGIKKNVYIIFCITILLLLLDPLAHYFWRNKRLKQES
jgi:hypothetical protein